jgi:hypothetical protein
MPHSSEYLKSIEKALSAGNATEHTHRPALKSFIESLADDITATNEPKRVKCGAPDFIVTRGETPLGYIEAKDVGKPLDREEKSEQMSRYLESLDNLLLTDYLEFRWYVRGEHVQTARLGTYDAGKERVRVEAEGAEEAHEMSRMPLFTQWLAEEANEASRIKQDAPVMVVLGNPPYSGHSSNTGLWIANLLRGHDTMTGKETGNYFEVDGKPLGERNPKWLNDDYVKFIRFAQWRIEQTGYGVLAFITNHGYLDNPTFRGMRQSLMETFDDIYVLNLHGNSKKKERAPDGTKDENVFDIQQGVAICLMVKRQARSRKEVAR